MDCTLFPPTGRSGRASPLWPEITPGCHTESIGMGREADGESGSVTGRCGQWHRVARCALGLVTAGHWPKPARLVVSITAIVARTGW